MTGIEDRHARFLTSIRPRLDNLAPLMVSEHGRGFWTVLADGLLNDNADHVAACCRIPDA